MEKKLHRIPDQAVFGGVASGIAQYFQIDVVIIRVLFVVMLFFPLPPGFGLTALIYIILWAVLPTGPVINDKTTSSDTDTSRSFDLFGDKKRSDQTVMILGGVLIFFGAVMLLDDLPVWYHIKQYFWPVALIGIGAFLILRQRDKAQESNTTVYPTTPPPTEPVEPDPELYTPFSANTSHISTHSPEDPEAKEAGDEDDDQIIKVN